MSTEHALRGQPGLNAPSLDFNLPEKGKKNNNKKKAIFIGAGLALATVLTAGTLILTTGNKSDTTNGGKLDTSSSASKPTSKNNARYCTDPNNDVPPVGKSVFDIPTCLNKDGTIGDSSKGVIACSSVVQSKNADGTITLTPEIDRKAPDFAQHNFYTVVFSYVRNPSTSNSDEINYQVVKGADTPVTVQPATSETYLENPSYKYNYLGTVVKIIDYSGLHVTQPKTAEDVMATIPTNGDEAFMNISPYHISQCGTDSVNYSSLKDLILDKQTR